jgi:hypothetical protein
MKKTVGRSVVVGTALAGLLSLGAGSAHADASPVSVQARGDAAPCVDVESPSGSGAGLDTGHVVINSDCVPLPDGIQP